MRRTPLTVVDTLLDRTVVGSYTRFGYDFRRRLPHWPEDPAPDSMVSRHVLVTGAGSGLGEETALELAALGATVHLVTRSEERARPVVEEVRRRQGAAADVRVHSCDVGDLVAVRELAGALERELTEEQARLAAIVHNAGVMPPGRSTSAQGHELSVAVHVLGPVLLTELLAERLRGGRSIFVTSGGMYAQKLDADDPEYLHGEYSPTTAYARSKRMQVELLPILAERWRSVTAAAMHPGWADTPGVRESLPRFHQLTEWALRDTRQGADTAVWLAATPERIEDARLWHDRRPRRAHLVPTTISRPEKVQQLWAWVCAQTGLDPEAESV